MGTQAIQGKLWGQRPNDWSEIQELTSKAGYEFALANVAVKPGMKCLDIGCGAGNFSKMINNKGIEITGIDASDPLIEEARRRVPGGTFLAGEMEELPFADNTFDMVSGFNSFQYAASTKNAIREARRVLKPGGTLIVMIWGNKEDCEAAIYLKAVGSLMPPPPPGAPGPFALSENKLLENILAELGFQVQINKDVDTIWEYPNQEIAMKGLLSAGPVARAIEHSGFDKVYAVTAESIKPFIQKDGRIVYRNKFRVVICKK